MAERRFVLGFLALAAGATACTFDLSSPEPEDPRLIDRACPNDVSCQTTGSAERTTGITGDSVGYRMGPSSGSVVIPLERKNMGSEFSLAVLASGSGTLEVSISGSNVQRSISLSKDYEWVEVDGSFPSSSQNFEDTVELTLMVGDGQSAEIADIRAHNLDYVNSCSVSAVGRR